MFFEEQPLPDTWKALVSDFRVRVKASPPSCAPRFLVLIPHRKVLNALQRIFPDAEVNELPAEPSFSSASNQSVVL